MGERRALVTVSVKPKCFKLEPRQDPTSSTSPPPSSPDVGTSTSEVSTIRLSKNWELPQRLKPGRKPKSRRANVSANKNAPSKIGKASAFDQKAQMITEDYGNEDVKDYTGKSGDEGNASGDENGTDSVEKRRKQNRDAQRAYRERRTTRIQVLEEKVEMLQNLVDDWQRKYKLLQSELNDTKENLHKSLALNNELQKTLPLFVNTPLQQQQQQQSHLHPEDPILTMEMIKNFKPMAAVNLKKRRAEEPLLESRIYTISMGESLTEIDVANDYQYATNRQYSSRNSSLDARINSPPSSCSSSNNTYAMPTLAPKCSSSKKQVSKCCQDKKIGKSENKPTTRKDGSWIPGSCEQCSSDPNSKKFCQSLSKGRSNSSKSALPSDASEQQTDVNCSSIKLPEISSPKNTQLNATSIAKKYLPISCTYQKIRQHMQKNKNVQEQLNTDDSASVSSVLENVAPELHVCGQNVELQSIKDALHKMDKNVLE